MCEGVSFDLDDRALYPCSTASGERDICSTDGTPQGTELLDIELQSEFSGDRHIVYFWGTRGKVASLWRSDGTRQGTIALSAVEIPELSRYLGLASAIVAPGLVVRTALSDERAEIWVIAPDGSNTERLSTPCNQESECHALPSQEVWQLDGLVLFFAFDGDGSIRLWATDGTLQGTQPVLDVTELLILSISVEEDGHWYALARSPELGEELYVSDGTASGSLRLTDFANANAFSEGGGDSPALAALGGRIWFAAQESATGRQLYSTPATTPGARQETRWVHGVGGYLGRVGGRPSLFGIDRPCGYGNQGGLWGSDGTPGRTTLALELTPFDCGGFPLPTTGAPISWGTGLAAPWRSPSGSYQLFWLGGVGQSPMQITDFASGQVHNPAQVGSASVYAVWQSGGWELWASDSPDSSSRFLAPLPANTDFTSTPQSLSNLVLFETETYFDRCEITRTDGTSAGTFALGFSAGEFSCPDMSKFTVTQAGGRGFFLMVDAEAHTAIWETDGTVANTRQFSSPNLRVLRFLQPTLMGGRIVFAADEDGQPSGLYAQSPDSTLALRLTDLAPILPAGTGAYPTLGAATTSRVFVTGFDPERGQELWSADALGGPFTLLMDIAPGMRSSYSQNLTVIDDRLLFSANDDSHGRELWLSDGTSAGTRMIWEVAQGGYSSYPSSLTPIGSDLVFSAIHPRFGQEVWILHLGPEVQGLIFEDDFETGTTAHWETSQN